MAISPDQILDRRDLEKYARLPEKDGRITSAVVPGWYLRPSWLFAEKRTNVLDALAELGVR